MYELLALINMVFIYFSHNLVSEAILSRWGWRGCLLNGALANKAHIDSFEQQQRLDVPVSKSKVGHEKAVQLNYDGKLAEHLPT